MSLICCRFLPNRPILSSPQDRALFRVFYGFALFEDLYVRPVIARLGYPFVSYALFVLT